MSYKSFEPFPRPKLKWQAKGALRGHWPAAVGIAFLMSIFSYLGSYSLMKVFFPSMTLLDYTLNRGNYIDIKFLNNIEPAQAMMVSLIALVVGVLISGAFTMAMTVWFMDLVQGNDRSTFGDFFANFSFALQGVLMYLWMTLWLMIWMLIGIAPMVAAYALDVPAGAVVFFLVACGIGIYKGIQYSLCFYALADNPEMGVREALISSIEAIRGHFDDVFFFGLSFIGWMIFASIIPFVNLYVLPYITASYALLWLHLRDEALDQGRMMPQTFGLVSASYMGTAHQVADDTAIPPYRSEPISSGDRVNEMADANDEEAKEIVDIGDDEEESHE